jgi:hypothetical protein
MITHAKIRNADRLGTLFAAIRTEEGFLGPRKTAVGMTRC